MSYLFICHDIALVQNFCDRVLVMYQGKIVEQGKTEEVLAFSETRIHAYVAGQCAVMTKCERYFCNRVICRYNRMRKANRIICMASEQKENQRKEEKRMKKNMKK